MSEPNSEPTASPPAGEHTPPRGSAWVKRAALIGAVAAAVALLVFGGVYFAGQRASEAGGPTPTASAPARFGPAVVELTGLQEQQTALGRPIYWAGEPGARKMELTVAADGGNTLRYLKAGKADAASKAGNADAASKAGNADAASARAVAMYPRSDAYTAAQAAARRVGSMNQKVPGGLVVGDTANAYNAYLALADLPYLIEVFDPEPGQAWQLVTAGKVVPVPK